MSEDNGRVPLEPGSSPFGTGAAQGVSAHSGDDPSREADPIVGHKTWADGSHTPLRKSEADTIWAAVEVERERREAEMPTEQDAINAISRAVVRLKELGWNEASYCPKDGSAFDAIEAGSTGIHKCRYEGKWPQGGWWIESEGDLWPSRPILYRRTEAEKAKWAALLEKFSRDSDTHRMAETPKSGSGRSLSSAVAKPIAESPSNTPPEPLTERWD